MYNKLFVLFVILVFIYFCYQQYLFQKNLWFSFKEDFTPQQVNNIIQSPGSHKIGTMDTGDTSLSKLVTVSNGYTEDTINNLKLDNPQPQQRREMDDYFGSFPNDLQEKYPLGTNEFEHSNNYNFAVKYPCRKTATGMFSECGVWSANLAWTANPFKGLNCPLNDTETPEHSNVNSRSREIEHREPHQSGISSTGNSMLR